MFSLAKGAARSAKSALDRLYVGAEGRASSAEEGEASSAEKELNDARHARDLAEDRAYHLQRAVDYLRGMFIYLPDTTRARQRTEKLAAFMVPHCAEGFGKIRLGKANDGGYVGLDDFQNIECAFSLGINSDVSWDIDAASRGLPIYQYDHTVSGPPSQHPLFRFRQTRIGTKEDGGATLADIVADASVTTEASTILKMDIEDSEWTVLDSTPVADLAVFSQMIIEFHNFDNVLDDQWYERAMRIFRKIHDRFRLVHVHGNNYGGQLVLGSRLFPRSMELTFANVTRYRLSPSGETFPTAHDMPNNPEHPDCGLDTFRFESSL